MGQRFPKVVKYRKVFKAFRKAGFKKVSQSGSHVKLKKKINKKEKTIILPRYPELDRDLILLILKEVGMTKEEFMKLVG